MNSSSKKSALWPVWVRLTHWALAAACILNLASLEEGDEPHQWVGYAAAALVVIRAIAGERSKKRALKLSSLLPRPHQILAELKKLIARKPLGRPEGHSPLAAPVMLGIWGAILVLALTGFMQLSDTFYGDEWVYETHELASNALWALIAAHLIGLAHDTRSSGKPTWKGMWSGQKG